MADNRLAFHITAPGADEFLAKMRQTREEAGRVRDAANQNERGLQKLGDQSGQTSRKLAELGRGAGSTGNAFRGLAGQIAGLAAAYVSLAAAARGIGFLFNSADQFRVLENRIRLVTDSAEEFAKVQTGLIDISRETFATISTTVQGYQRMAAASERLGISQDRLLGITKTVNQAVALSGASTQAAESSLIQFGQALSNNFQASAQEINSINEQVFALGDAIARGITKITGVEVFRSDLKKLAEEGKLTSELVIKALEAVGPEIEDTFANLQRTKAQVGTVIVENIRVLAKEAFGPVVETQIEAYKNIASALSSPEALQSAKEFGRTIDAVAKGILGNFDAIAKAAQGLAAALAFAGVVSAVNAVRTAFLALSAAITANPVGLLITALGVAIGLIVTFRDEIARALTPFKDFNELAKELSAFFAQSGLFEPKKIQIDFEVNAGSITADQIKNVQARLAQIAERQQQIRIDLVDPVARVSSQEAAKLRQEYIALSAEAQKINAHLFTAGKATNEIANAAGAANDNFGNLGKTVVTVEQSLRNQLATAEKLAEAAKGGQVSFDIAENAAKLDEAARKAVDQATEAGEKLSFETARILVGQTDALLKGAQAMLDAEKALRDRASEKAKDLAADIKSQIDSALNSPALDLRGNSPREIVAFATASQKIIADLRDFLASDASIGIDADTLIELQKVIDEGARGHAEQVRGAVIEGSREGALGLYAKIRQALADGIPKIEIAANVTSDFARVGEKFFDGLNGAVEAFRRNADKAFSDIARLVSDVGRNVGDSLKNIGSVIGGSFGGALGTAGAVVGAVADIAGLISSAVDFIKNVFGKPSQFAATTVINPQTGAVIGSAQRDNSEESQENARVRDAVSSGISDITKLVSDLTGASISKLLNITVGNRRGIEVGFQGPGGTPVGGAAFEQSEAGAGAAIRKGVELAISALKGGEAALVNFAKQAIASGQSIDDLVPVLRVLSDVTATGQKALIDYALAAAKAGQSGDEIAAGIQAFDAALKLAAPKLSTVEQSIKGIDDASKPVIDNLKALKLSIAGVSSAAQTAIRAVGTDFISRIRDDLDRLSNADLADFKQLLKAQGQDTKDAQLLLARGGITQDEFRLVQQRNALAQTKFFEGLDQDALNSLGDFLGLVRENGGAAAVALLQFNQEMDRTRESLTSGLSKMREEADRFFAAANANFNLSKDIRFRLSNETGTTQLATFRGELQGLLAQAKGPDREAAVTAAERAPDVARQFIELAERQFGASAGLGAARDFVTDILNQIGTAAQGLGNQTLDAITLAEQQVSLLDKIKATLESPDPALPILQSILTNGELQSATLQGLLDQYVQAAYAGPAQNFTPGQVQQAAQQIVLPSELKITNTVTTEAPGVTGAINTAANQAKQDAENTREAIVTLQRTTNDMQEAITKLDQTLRAQAR